MALLSRLWLFVTQLRTAIGNLLFIALIVLIVVLLAATPTPSVPAEAVLILDPRGVVVEQKRITDPLFSLLGNNSGESETLQRDLLDAIATAATDERIRLMVLELDDFRGASMASLAEIGQALDVFRESGKPIFAYSDAYTQSQYFLAAHADHVFLNKRGFQPLGGVFLTGLGVYPTFYKSALDTLKVNYHVFQAGLYKSAVEPYQRDNMSEAARVATSAWLEVLWDEYRSAVIRGRGISLDAFERYTKDYDKLLAAADTPGQVALDAGFVDELIDRPAWEEKLGDALGAPLTQRNGISLGGYLAAVRSPLGVVNPTTDKVAVIVARGVITEGRQPPGVIGSESLIRLIERARKDDSVRALVLRIDSPGGSPTAAEAIRQALETTRDDGKPVVVSMSSAAASGGYWIAATADRIIASPATITGSIGAFALFPTFENSLSHVGVHTDGVGTTPYASGLDPFQTLSPIMRRTLQGSVDSTYRRFIEVVAEGRNIAASDVDAIAQGRVWAGRTAVELGLVDALGNLNDAIKSAAHLAEIDRFDVMYLEKELSTRERLLQELMRVSTPFQQMDSTLQGLTSELAALLQGKRSGVFAQCLHCRVSL